MHEINTESILFYGLAWAIAFVACFCRSYRDVSSVGFWNVCASSGMAGVLAFGFVTYVGDGGGGIGADGAHSRWYFLGLAALLGLVAKDPDKIAWIVISKAMAAIKSAIPDNTNERNDEPKKD